ncbi:MAG: hypothetical protein ACD_45C00079G0004 [uncultured bacterium]|nr:MAG: hypothetical protein ACD_45C00079G0004 [uncultured bacterium]
MTTLFSPHKFIYEVNLTIQRDIFETHRTWLIDHFHQMVKQNNFIQLNLCFLKNTNPIDDHHLRYQSIVAQYLISDYPILEEYFEKQAKVMRSQVVDKLGCHYTVRRRVLEVVESFRG